MPDVLDVLNAELDIEWLERFGITREALVKSNKALIEVIETSPDERAVIMAAKAIHDNTVKIVGLQLRCTTHAVQMKRFLGGDGELPAPESSEEISPAGFREPVPKAIDPEKCLDGLVVN